MIAPLQNSPGHRPLTRHFSGRPLTLNLVLLFMGFFSFFTGCARPGLVEGGLYYTAEPKGGYAVLKVLKLDPQGVHLRLYSNVFSSPPQKIDANTLYIADQPLKPGETRGMGHVPVSRQGFESWHAVFFQQSTVKEEELEGYKIWLEAKGGYF